MGFIQIVILKVKRYIDFKVMISAILLIIVFVFFIVFKNHYSITMESMKEHIAAGILVSIMEIFLLFFIFHLFIHLDENKRDIKRYLEEINDFRGWQEPEAAYRLSGLIRRLNELNVVSGIDLKRCYLKKANLQGVKLLKANLSGTNFEESNLQEACLDKAELYGNFEGANLKKTYLENACLAGNFKRACFRDAHLEKADLFKSDFEGAELNYSYFEGACIERSNFKGASLVGTNFKGAEFENVLFEGANLESAVFENAEFHGIELKDSCLCYANFKNAKNITWEQLSVAKSLYLVENLDPEIEKVLKKDFKHLFEKTNEILEREAQFPQIYGMHKR